MIEKPEEFGITISRKGHSASVYTDLANENRLFFVFLSPPHDSFLRDAKKPHFCFSEYENPILSPDDRDPHPRNKENTLHQNHQENRNPAFLKQTLPH